MCIKRRKIMWNCSVFFIFLIKISATHMIVTPASDSASITETYCLCVEVFIVCMHLINPLSTIKAYSSIHIVYLCYMIHSLFKFMYIISINFKLWSECINIKAKACSIVGVSGLTMFFAHTANFYCWLFSGRFNMTA